MAFDITATTEETKIVKTNIKSRTGRGKPTVQNPTWTLNGPGTLVPDAVDPLKALYTTPDELDPVDPLNDVARISFNGDADLGEGVKAIEDSGMITVVNPQAESVGLDIKDGPEKP